MYFEVKMKKRPQIDSLFVDTSGRLTRVWRKFVEHVGDSIKVFEDQNASRPAQGGGGNEINKSFDDIRKTNRPNNSTVELEKEVDNIRKSLRPSLNISEIEKAITNSMRSAMAPLRAKINELEKEIEDIRRSMR
jgi:hypothetical protein